MPIDVETAVNLTSSALTLLFGVGAAIVATDKRRGWALALYAAAFAGSTAASNVETIVGGYPFVLELARFALYAAAGAGAFLLALTLTRGEAARTRRNVALSVTLAATLIICAGTWSLMVATRGWGAATLIFLIGGALGGSTLLAVEFANAPTPVERTRLALCGAALAIYGGFYAPFFVGSNSPSVSFLLLWGPLVPVAAFAWTLAARAGPAARNVSLLVVLSGFVGLVVSLTDASAISAFGFPGVTRLVGIAILAYAVFRLDLLGTGFAPRTVHRGTLATVALAALFIVAQIAQNFLAAQYGLLMGAVVAGSFLYAAQPIQRAIERTREPRAQTFATSPTVRGEESYRKALRLALRDRQLTREEETHLHELARDLGIDGPRAHALLAEAEAARRKRGR